MVIWVGSKNDEHMSAQNNTIGDIYSLLRRVRRWDICFSSLSGTLIGILQCSHSSGLVQFVGTQIYDMWYTNASTGE